MSVSVRSLMVSDNDCRDVAKNMRESDKKEVWFSHGQSPELAVVKSIQNSHYAYCAYHNDKPISVFGVATSCMTTNQGSPWLLGTDDIVAVKSDLLRYSKACVQFWKTQYLVLENYIHAGNFRSMSWLCRLGFEFEDAESYGPSSEIFIKFRWERNHV